MATSMRVVPQGHLHPALAGAVAAMAWGAFSSPSTGAFFCSDYSDVMLLGKLVTRGRLACPVGFAIHALNGVVFGLARLTTLASACPSASAGWPSAYKADIGLYPLSYFVDRFHPARGEKDLPSTLQRSRLRPGTLWHALFGPPSGARLVKNERL